MDADWTSNDAYRAIPQMEHGDPVQVIGVRDNGNMF